MATKSKKRLKAYAKAREIDGKTQEQAKAIAGYSPNYSPTEIERNPAYPAIVEKLAEKLDKFITKDQVAEKLSNNILQEKDINGSNTAIKIYKDITEPQGITESNEEKVIIIFKDTNITLNNKNATESIVEDQNQAETYKEENIDEAIIKEAPKQSGN
jgi:hypothetical protein